MFESQVPGLRPVDLGRPGAVVDSRGECRDVVLLGAGFSSAVAAGLPLTDELGRLAVAQAEADGRDRIPHPEFRDGNFEIWLSRVAEDQPYLDAAANIQNRAWFTRISQGIRAVLAERQAAALAAGASAWLYDLLSVLHERRVTVLTLNYDNLVECAVDGRTLYDWPGSRWVTSTDVLNDMPPAAGQPSGPRPEGLAGTFRLLKLHGSLSWYWSPGDETGATLQRWTTPGTFGAPVLDEDQDARRRVLPGREPFIVPPSAAKSGYYRNLVTRELWAQAFAALSRARRILLIGYSLPAGDLTVSGMISDAVAGREVTFQIVNPQPGPVRERLASLGVADPQAVQAIDGPDCVEQFTYRYRDEQAGELVKQLSGRDSPLSGPLLVSWGNTEGQHPGHVQPVARISAASPAGNDDVLLYLTGSDEPMTPERAQLSDLLVHLPGATRMVAVTVGGRKLPIIGMWTRMQPQGNGKIRWVTLVPAGQPGF